MEFMKMNIKFKVGQKVECIMGYNKGKRFIIIEKNNDAYGLKSVDSNDSKTYQYNDEWLELVK